MLVGVDGLKTSLYLKLDGGQGIRFSDRLPPVYFEQLTSERALVRYVRGQPVRRWERIPGRQAEALDCLVYAMAARAGLPSSRALRTDPQPIPPPPLPVVRSAFVDRW